MDTETTKTVAVRTLEVMAANNIWVGQNARVGSVIDTKKGAMTLRSASDLLNSWANGEPNPSTAPAVHAIADVVDRVLRERKIKVENVNPKPSLQPMIMKGSKK